MNGLQFTDEAARQLEKAYLTRDVIAQRSETIRHLSLSVGERVLDIGCGPGFLCEGMGEIVGPKGAVLGIDISADLIARCNGRKTSAHLSYEVGDATKLNQPNAFFDVVVCTQVAEYVADVERVFSEAFRVLKPNGRTVFVATDWHTILWYSDNPRRMAAVMKSWEGHSAHPRLPCPWRTSLSRRDFVLMVRPYSRSSTCNTTRIATVGGWHRSFASSSRVRTTSRQMTSRTGTANSSG